MSADWENRFPFSVPIFSTKSIPITTAQTLTDKSYRLYRDMCTLADNERFSLGRVKPEGSGRCHSFSKILRGASTAILLHFLVKSAKIMISTLARTRNTLGTQRQCSHSFELLKSHEGFPRRFQIFHELCYALLLSKQYIISGIFPHHDVQNVR